MEQEKITLLEDYFNGLLDTDGQERVSQLRNTDPAFEVEYELRSDMQYWLQTEPERKAIRSHTDQLGAEFFGQAAQSEPTIEPTPATPFKVFTNWKVLSAAASLALLVGVVWWLNQSGPATYASYAQHDPLQINLRASGDNLAAEAEQAFNQKNYDKAAQSLAQLANQDPQNATIQLYLAIAEIEIGQSAAARTRLSPLAAGNSLFQDDAQWYMAMSYLATGDLSNCKSELKKLPAGSRWAAKAKQILK